MTRRVRNWKKFQHFKDRRPPWIKLYRDLLDSHDWHNLDGDSSKTLVMLWLLASETDDGSLPTIPELAFRLRTTETRIKSTLTKLSSWLIQDDIKLISLRHQSDLLEEEEEVRGERLEEEVRGEKEIGVAPSSDGAAPTPSTTVNGWGTPESLMALYNDACPSECPAAETLSPKRREKAKRLLRAFPDKAYWEEAFREVHKSTFLRGMCAPGKGHAKAFVASFDWLLSCGKDGTENIVQVWERKYGNQA